MLLLNVLYDLWFERFKNKFTFCPKQLFVLLCVNATFKWTCDPVMLEEHRPTSGGFSGPVQMVVAARLCCSLFHLLEWKSGDVRLHGEGCWHLHLPLQYALVLERTYCTQMMMMASAEMVLHSYGTCMKSHTMPR